MGRGEQDQLANAASARFIERAESHKKLICEISAAHFVVEAACDVHCVVEKDRKKQDSDIALPLREEKFEAFRDVLPRVVEPTGSVVFSLDRVEQVAGTERPNVSGKGVIFHQR